MSIKDKIKDLFFEEDDSSEEEKEKEIFDERQRAVRSRITRLSLWVMAFIIGSAKTKEKREDRS